MSLAKRLDLLVLESRMTEAEAEGILEAREALWAGRGATEPACE